MGPDISSRPLQKCTKQKQRSSRRTLFGPGLRQARREADDLLAFYAFPRTEAGSRSIIRIRWGLEVDATERVSLHNGGPRSLAAASQVPEGHILLSPQIHRLRTGVLEDEIDWQRIARNTDTTECAPTCWTRGFRPDAPQAPSPTGIRL